MFRLRPEHLRGSATGLSIGMAFLPHRRISNLQVAFETKISGVVRLVKVKDGPVVDHQTGEMPTLRGWNRSSDWGTGGLGRPGRKGDQMERGEAHGPSPGGSVRFQNHSGWERSWRWGGARGGAREGSPRQSAARRKPQSCSRKSDEHGRPPALSSPSHRLCIEGLTARLLSRRSPHPFTGSPPDKNRATVFLRRHSLV